MEYSTGSLGQGGAQEQAVAICFVGALGQPFVEFARERASRLALRGVIEQRCDTVVASLEGPEALIDAFEITCSLGPIACRVDFWSRTETSTGSNVRA
ncbi:hypothetical protein KEU06_26335 [Pseudaminobacter sp. 19-2017]|uniref:Acylphosphatase-like domain-containing protein n=1 Tax=Pseudaminobacter soli (ex Zhang et al. 2022) TaxID=2831468 RepID=A0A942E727_9HYPH|nr:hypothetical protein [Pseudaminobacter soli]MBS3652121.1 hypothetical protein [Pseudaminobacter soli]